MPCDRNTFKPLFYFLGMGLHTCINKKVMMTYLDPCQWRPVVSTIDLISPLRKYSFILLHLDLKSTPKDGNSIALPPSTAVKVDGNFHDISMGLETICIVGDYLWRTPP